LRAPPLRLPLRALGADAPRPPRDWPRGDRGGRRPRSPRARAPSPVASSPHARPLPPQTWRVQNTAAMLGLDRQTPQGAATALVLGQLEMQLRKSSVSAEWLQADLERLHDTGNRDGLRRVALWARAHCTLSVRMHALIVRFARARGGRRRGGRGLT
jgi:hypothetical protein